MICSSCGKEVADDAAICANCGGPIAQKPAKSNAKQANQAKQKSRYQLGCVASIGGLLPLLAGGVISAIFIYSKLNDDPSTAMTLQSYLCCLLPLLLIGGVLIFIGFKSIKCTIGSHQWGASSYIAREGEPIADSCKRERVCNYCQKHETQQEQPHSWNEWKYISRSSCDQARSCTLCQVKESRIASHDWEDWKYKPDSCEQERECRHCHQRETKAAVHDWEDWKYKPDSCDQVRRCRRCHIPDTKVAAHDWGDWILSEDKIHETRHCKRCSLTGSRLPPLQQKVAAQIAVLKAGQPIWDSLNDPKTVAHRALIQIGEPSVLPLLAAAKECTGFRLELILKCLGEIGDVRAFDLFMEALKSPLKDIRAKAALGLGQLGKAEAVPVLIEALQDSEDDVRGNAAEALGMLKDPRAVEPLMVYARSKTGQYQSAVEALGRLKDKRAIDLLIDVALNDQKQDTRNAAKEALVGFPPEAMARLNEKLKGEAVKISSASQNLYTRMHDQNKKYDTENPITLENSEAILYYETRQYEEFQKSWVLQIPWGSGKYEYRRIQIDPEQSPDQTVAGILEKAPEWCITIDSMDRLYQLITCGVPFNYENAIQIKPYATIYLDQKKVWCLKVHVSRMEDRDYKLTAIDENIGQKVKDIIAATGISMM